jgi:hypothetical protein
MFSNEKVVNYKVVDYSEIYNFAFDHFLSEVICIIQKIEF